MHYGNGEDEQGRGMYGPGRAGGGFRRGPGMGPGMGPGWYGGGGRRVRGMWGGGGRGPGGGRGRRGDVRAAILALLAERPMHGYEMLQELAERTQDLWRPSPGSLYPALQLLEDQGLVRSVEGDGRRRYELTDEGRADQVARQGQPAPWEVMVAGADQGTMALRSALRQVAVAVAQVAEAGSPDQKARAGQLLADVRRQVYLLLAEAPVDEG